MRMLLAAAAVAVAGAPTAQAADMAPMTGHMTKLSTDRSALVCYTAAPDGFHVVVTTQEGLTETTNSRMASATALRHPASGITLGQIYKAVESVSGVFAMRSQVHERSVVACAMTRRLGPIFNAANDALQALSESRGAGRGHRLNLPETESDTDMFNPRSDDSG